MFFEIRKWWRSFSEARRKKRECKALYKLIEETARDAIIMARFSV
jgi:hypothetical protein